MKIAVVACVHGNEQYGLAVGKNSPSSCSFFVANEEAVRQNKRYIDTDLNRCFPGSIDGNHEERLAFALRPVLAEFDVVIDLHSTSQECPMFGIITMPNPEKIRLAEHLGLRRLVVMMPGYASGKTLIDWVKCGISLEVGPHERKENVSEALEAIRCLRTEQASDAQPEIFEVFDVLKAQTARIVIRNFEEVRQGQTIAVGTDGATIAAPFDFVAVLVAEREYKDTICLTCRRRSQDQDMHR